MPLSFTWTDKAYDFSMSNGSEEEKMVHSEYHRPKDSELDEFKPPPCHSSKSEQERSENFPKPAYSSERKDSELVSFKPTLHHSSKSEKKRSEYFPKPAYSSESRIPHVSGNAHMPQEVRGETDSTVNIYHRTPNEYKKINVKQKLLMKRYDDQRLYMHMTNKLDQEREANLLQLVVEQNKKIEKLQATVRDFGGFKPELTKLKAERNKLQHQHNEEKKDNEQRNRNILEQLANNEKQLENLSEKVKNNEQQFENILDRLTNNEQRFEKMSRQLTQLDTNTNEVKALHSKVDSVNQAQAVIGNSLKQTKDFIDTVKTEMKSDLAEATSQLKEGQSIISKDMQSMCNLIQEVFSKKSVETPKKKRAKNHQCCN
ncbi:centrosomal protein Cep290-like [Mytilus trossulus]|uniref:centrosomal protein Cep290-like n=1 Tax=Mytilus trossulus TaxID=6551 RepID=UPI0030074E6B